LFQSMVGIAGRTLMVVALAKSSPHVKVTKRRMVHFAILFVELGTTVLVQFAGSIALMDSAMMVLSASSPKLMDVELVMLSGMRTSATVRMLMLVARNGVLCGILSAEQTSTMLLAVFAHLTAQLVKLILAFLVLKTLMAVVLALHLSAVKVLR
jgi:hypothetical protein